ncbi:MAG: alkaline phosphatase family protein [Saprospiraceae bacterium]|nr:alkaline phosphatase family protein [Saprospiraceae bacterium]
MQKLFILFIFIMGLSFSLNAQTDKLKTKNVVIITLDGFRWQELFGGVDSVLLNDKTFTPDPKELNEPFWASTAEVRRQKLLPFFWNTIAKQGQLYGNRWKNNKVDVTNQMWFSYPGYNEILSGFADDEHITSNDKFNNPNKTVLEFINNQKGFNNKVAAFGSWDVFPYIINTERSKIPVNAGFEQIKSNNKLSEKEKLLYELQEQIPEEWSSVRFDAFTHHFAKEYIIKNKPRVIYIAYGETDDFAHDGAYNEYIKSTHQTDAFIADLWNFTQNHSFYKDKTTFIITTDHGRGTQPIENWKHHGRQIPDADQIWIAVLGPDTPALGEVTTTTQLYQNQVAKTAAALLGLDYKNTKEVGAVITSALKK